MPFPRFYLPKKEIESKGLVLSEGEAHHCHDVLRLREGDRAVVFDGEGREHVCKIEQASSKEVLLKEIQQQKTPRLPFRMTLAQAIPKGKTMDTIIHKATELGVHRIIPVTSERTVVRVEAGQKDADAKRERWREIVVEAAKLSGNNWLPEVDGPRTVRELAAEVRQHDLAVVGSLQPGSRFLKDYLDEYAAEKKNLPLSVLVCIGPEGDYTPAEVGQLVGAGCQPITLGQVVLKSDTAAIYALSTLAYELQTRKV
jgi:16S rRNA (uracil1498-N3)-methyltransferase